MDLSSKNLSQPPRPRLGLTRSTPVLSSILQVSLSISRLPPGPSIPILNPQAPPMPSPTSRISKIYIPKSRLGPRPHSVCHLSSMNSSDFILSKSNPTSRPILTHISSILPQCTLSKSDAELTKEAHMPRSHCKNINNRKDKDSISSPTIHLLARITWMSPMT